MDKLYTTKEVAGITGATPGTIKRWEGNGTLPATRDERGFRVFRHQDLVHFMREMGMTAHLAQLGEPMARVVIASRKSLISALDELMPETMSLYAARTPLDVACLVGSVKPSLVILDANQLEKETAFTAQWLKAEDSDIKLVVLQPEDRSLDVPGATLLKHPVSAQLLFDTLVKIYPWLGMTVF